MIQIKYPHGLTDATLFQQLPAINLGKADKDGCPTIGVNGLRRY